MNFLKIGLVGFCLFTSFAAVAQADDNIFINSAHDGNWFNAANWSLGHLPTVSETAVVDSSNEPFPTNVVIAEPGAVGNGLVVGTVSSSGIIISDHLTTNSVTLGLQAGSFGTLDLKGVLTTAQVQMGAGGGEILFDAGVLQLTGDQMDLFANAQNGIFNFDSGFETFDTQSFNVATSAFLQGFGGLIKIGTGTLTLSGDNGYFGGTNLNQGTLILGSSGALSSVGTITFNGGTLKYSSANTTDYSSRFNTAAGQQYNVDTNGQNITWSSALSSSGGSLTKSGAGILTLSGSNTYDGGTTLVGGALSLGSSEALGSTGAITFSGGTLQYSSANTTDYSARFNTVAGQQYNVDTNGQNITWSSALTSSGGSLVKSGSGTLILSGNNTYDDGTNILGGTLQAGSATALRSGATGADYAINGGTLDLNNFNLTISSLSGTGGDVALGTATLTVNQTCTTAFAGAITGMGGFTKTGAGALTLSGTSNFSGSLSPNEGTLNITGNVTNAGTSGIATTGLVATLNITGSGANWTDTADTLIGLNGGTGYLNISNGATASDTFSLVGRNSTSDAGYVTVTGPGSTWTHSAGLVIGTGGVGSMLISDGGHVSNTDGTLGDNAGSIGTVRVTGSNSLWTSTSFLNIGAGGTGTLNVDSGGTVQVGGTGAGLITLGGANTGSGVLNIGAAMGQAALDPGTIETATITGGSDSVGNVVNFNHTSLNYTFAPNLTGNLSVEQNAGTTILTGTNTYTGDTTISGGILSLGSSEALAGSGALSFDGGTLQYSSGNTTDYSSRLSTAAGQQYSIDTNGQDVTWASNLASSGGSLTKTGTGILFLMGNTYNVDITVDGGTVQMGDSPSAILDEFSPPPDGLIFDNNDDITINGNISASAGIFLVGTGTTTVTGTISSDVSLLSGGLNIAGKNAILTQDFLDVAAALTIANGGTVRAQSTVVVAGNPGENGQVIVSGAGSSLTAADQLQIGAVGTGSMSISKGGQVSDQVGTLGQNVTSVFQGFDDITIYVSAGTATVDGVGSTWTNTTELDIGFSGTGTLTISNGGLVTSPITYLARAANNPTLNVSDIASQGSLNLESGGVLATGQLIHGDGPIASVTFDGGILRATADSSDFISNFTGTEVTLLTGGGTIDNGGYAIAVNSPITGTGSLTFIGTGTTTLTGTNTYTGDTTVSGGTLGFDSDANLGAASSILTMNGSTLHNTDNATLSQPIVLEADSTFDVDAGKLAVLTPISGAGGLIKTGSNVLSLSGNQAYTGATQVLDGELVVGPDGLGASSLASSSISISSGATLSFSGSQTYLDPVHDNGTIERQSGGTTLLGDVDFSTGASTLNVQSGGTLQIGSGNAGGTVFQGTINGNLAINFSGSGSSIDQMTGNGTVTYAGSGTLNILEAGSAFAPITLYNTGGGTLRYAGPIGFGDDGSTVNNNIVLNNGTLLLDQGGDATGNGTVFGGTISGSGSVVVNGYTVLTGTNTYTGGTQVQAMQEDGEIADVGLEILNDASLGDDSGALTLGNDTMLVVVGTTTLNRKIILGDNVDIGAISTLTLSPITGDNVTFGAPLRFPGVFPGTNSRTIVLTGQNFLNTLSVIGDTNVIIGNGASLTSLSSNLEFATVTVTGSGSLWDAGLQLTGGGGDVFNQDGSIDKSAVLTISDGGAFRAGQVQVSSLTVQSGGTATVGILDLSGLSSINFSAATQATDVTLSATSTGAGSLLSAGQVQMGGVWNGQLTVADGGRIQANSILMLSSSTHLGTATVELDGTEGSRGVLNVGEIEYEAANGANNLIFDGGILQAASSGVLIQSPFGGTIPVTVNAGGAFIDTNGFNSTFSPGVILTGVGSLTKLGEGMLTLSGSNTYQGGTTIKAGTLAVANNSALGTGDVNVSGGMLQVTQGYSVANTITLSGGKLAQQVAMHTQFSSLGTYKSAISGGTPTSAQLLGGQTSASGNIVGGFANMSLNAFSAANDNSRISDIFSLSGVPMVDSTTGQTDVFVLQLRLDPALLMSSSVLAWLDPSTNSWTNAVDGNFGGTATFVSGAYNADKDFQLGDYGVDTTNGTVWAVLDHNSSFSVAAVPEPSTWVMLGLGLAALVFVSRRRKI